jgi:hypothetical protein
LQIKRADILDFRERLIERMGYTRTVQKAVSVLKTILKEAYFREDIARDPTAGIGVTKYNPKEVSIFTEEELQTLFPAVLGGQNGLPLRETENHCGCILLVGAPAYNSKFFISPLLSLLTGEV